MKKYVNSLEEFMKNVIHNRLVYGRSIVETREEGFILLNNLTMKPQSIYLLTSQTETV